jgi:cobalt-precorrin 5A hydrolase
MTGLIAIGVGCRKSCASEAIVAIVRRALADCGQAAWPVLAGQQTRDSLPPCGGGQGRGVARRCPLEAQSLFPLAQRDPPSQPSPTRGEGEAVPRLFSLIVKRDEPGLRAAAETLRFELVFLPREALAAVASRLLTRSAAAQRRFGLDSVAEAAALAGAGPNGRLLAPRLAADGATCAIAVDCSARRGDPP